jgi:hypothetical protein
VKWWSCKQNLATHALHVLDAIERSRHIQARGDLTQDQVLYDAALCNLQTLSDSTSRPCSTLPKPDLSFCRLQQRQHSGRQEKIAT